MVNYIIIWIGLGLLTNVYYFSRNHNKYNQLIKNDKLKVKSLIVGFLLTLILFPVSIYSNEFSKKSKK